MDNKIIQVALDGLENILKIGELNRQNDPDGLNRYALYIEECGGMELIHQLQTHENVEIYKKAYNMIDRYFADEDAGEEMTDDVNLQSFSFQPNVNIPQQGFNFGPQ